MDRRKIRRFDGPPFGPYHFESLPAHRSARDFDFSRDRLFYRRSDVRLGKTGPMESPQCVKDRRAADIWISAAGPISNVLALVGFAVLYKLFGLYEAAGLNFLGSAVVPLFQMCLIGVQLNVILAVFNMLPIPAIGWKLDSSALPAARIGAGLRTAQALWVSDSAGLHVARRFSGGLVSGSGRSALHDADVRRMQPEKTHSLV